MAKNKHMVKANIRANINPSAQTAGLCVPDYNPELMRRMEYVASIIEKNKVNGFGAVTELLFTYGLRISECLNITGFDVKSDGGIKINTLKGGSVRIVYPIICGSFWKSFAGVRFTIGSIFSRFYFYREFKKLGIYEQFGVNDNYSCTHYLRHLKVLQLLSDGYTKQQISSFIGHKNKKTLEYYVAKIKK